MNKITPVETYQLYLAMKSHFTGKGYDYFKYNGKIGATMASFEKRKDKWFFTKLSRLYEKDDMIDLMVSNFAHNDKVYILQLFDEKAQTTYKQYKKIKQSLEYTFTEDIKRLMDIVPPVDLFKIVNGNNPPVLEAVYNKEITMETFVILEGIKSFYPYFNKHLNDDILWPMFRTKCEKFAPFLGADYARFKEILKKVINERVAITA